MPEVKVIDEHAEEYLSEHIQQPGAMIPISPEGTRNDKGKLLFAHPVLRNYYNIQE